LKTNILLIVFIQFFFCKSTFAQKPNKENEFSNLLIKATGEKISGDLSYADSIYDKCLEIIPNSAIVYFEKSGIYRSENKLKKAIYHAEKAVDISPKNEWYLANLALLYKEDKNYKKSSEIFYKLSNYKPKKVEYLFSLVESYLEENKIKKAIKILNIIEQRVGENEEILLQKHQLYNYLNKRRKALKILNQIVQNDSSNIRNLGMLAEYYESLNKKVNHIEVLEKMMELDSANGLVRLSMFQHYYKNKKYLEGLEELKKVIGSNEVDQTIKTEILSQISYDQNSPYTLNNVSDLTKIFINKHPDNSTMLLFYGNLKFLLQEQDSACHYLRKSLMINPLDYSVWVQLMSSCLSMGNYSDALKDATSAIENHPNQPFSYFVKGLVLNINEKYSVAAEILKNGINLIIEDPVLESDFYHQLGEAYYKLNDFNTAFENFEYAIKINPENLVLLNNYSYYLALRKQNLKRAEDLIIKTLKSAPENSTFLDTYGWILFQKEQYYKAEEIMFKAIMLSEEKVGEILEHYGDVLSKIGKEKEALLFWKKAKKVGDCSKKLDDKIKFRRYVE
tara:strand:- start:1939 stop:3630 length:1692 start_codon:yes stop_codon:yes gene_type:complete